MSRIRLHQHVTEQYENVSDYVCYLGAHTLLCSLLSRNALKDSVTFTLEDIENERHRFINHGTMSYMGHDHDVTRIFLDRIPFVVCEHFNYTDIKNSKYIFNLKTFMQSHEPPNQVEKEICETETNYIKLCLFWYFNIPFNWGHNMYECLGMDFLLESE